MPSVPGAVPVKVFVAVLTKTVVLSWRRRPDRVARSGVLKYSYAGNVICSTNVPSVLASRSYTVSETSALLGSMIASLI